MSLGMLYYMFEHVRDNVIKKIHQHYFRADRQRKYLPILFSSTK